MHLATIPPEAPFLDTLARRWLDGVGGEEDALARGLILLPTRRAARALADAFLRAGGGRPMLLPRIAAIGALDEAPLALAGALDLAPAVEPAERLAVLSRLVLALPEAAGGVRAADRAWRLAGELATLLDDAARCEIDLAKALEGAADAAYAEHWAATLRFLGIVTRAWPDWLSEQGLSDPAVREVKLLRAQAAAWATAPPEGRVWAAGLTAGTPAVGALLRVVARLERGLVLFPGLDLAMPDSAWEALGPGHPQTGLRALLAAIDARRAEVKCWELPGADAGMRGRAAALAAALLPAAAIGAWRERTRVDLGSLSLIEPADAQEEAVAIAMVLRDALEVAGARAALVTPDRALARRVATELLRWGVVADDSAGETLSLSPPAVFLRLIAETVATEFAPVPLLGLLKHPLAAAGLATAECRAAARALEVKALRGPKPAPGLAELRRIGDAGFVAALEACLEPVLRAVASATIAPGVALAALVEAGEALATTDAEAGPARLWAHEEGEALATLLGAALPALSHLPDQRPATLPGLLDALLDGAVVRSRRALRGRDAVSEHPRVFIWGLLEARLQSAETIVLGGLTEGVWPPATDPGPWLSRPMRARAGLDDPDARVGQAAHDFVQAACAAPRVVLSCPRRREGAPAVPSRFLTRLRAWLAGQEATLEAHPAASWAARLDQPHGKPRPVPPPCPRPAARHRPQRLSVTAIETLIADPYAIYARHVLGLRVLKPLEQPTDAADYGTIVHGALQAFLDEVGVRWPADAREKLRTAMDRALSEARVRRALAEWWAPRLHRIADWVAEEETCRRGKAPPARLGTEREGKLALDVAGKSFLLTGRADRIEARADGTVSILDYKTGALPQAKKVEAGEAPQLPLEAAMTRAGAFGPEFSGPVTELIYWHLPGGHDPGKAVALLGSNPDAIAAELARAQAALLALLERFADPATPYLSQPHPGRLPRFPDYAHLARVAEWERVGEG